MWRVHVVSDLAEYLHLLVEEFMYAKSESKLCTLLLYTPMTSWAESGVAEIIYKLRLIDVSLFGSSFCVRSWT